MSAPPCWPSWQCESSACHPCWAKGTKAACSSSLPGHSDCLLRSVLWAHTTQEASTPSLTLCSWTLCIHWPWNQKDCSHITEKWNEANKEDLCFSYLSLRASPKRRASLSLFTSFLQPQPALPLSPSFQPALAQAQAATPNIRPPLSG